MKKKTNLWQRFLLVMLALSASIGASAYDFTATSNGKTIYYNITQCLFCTYMFTFLLASETSIT